MQRPIPSSDRLPHALYRADQVRELDRSAIEDQGIPGAELMERAGRAAYELLRRRWPVANDISVVCGIGNNGGDGYVVARLALGEGLSVRVLQLGDVQRLRGDALTMATRFRNAGGSVEPFAGLPQRTDLIVDAILGTGLEREVTGEWAQAIDAINAHRAPVMAIDIPSGLHSDLGRILGTAIRAEATISFIGLKQGMFTGVGPDCCGEIRFDALQVPAVVYSGQILSARRLDWANLCGLLGRRPRSANKGTFGHVLVVGGAPGYSGAPRLAGEGALRTGAGLVTVATHPQHAAYLNLNRPELMCPGVAGPAELNPFLERATVVAVGPGLGKDSWGKHLLGWVLGSGLPLVVDADALNLVAASPSRHDNWVLTPHPGEAARLLGIETGAIQADRFGSVRRLQERFGGVAVLKGAGTLIYGGSHKPPGVCDGGNPGMATAGTGDVLTGMIAALIAQGLSLEDAACTGVCLHAAAGDAAARDGERGLVASDLLANIRPLLNGTTAP
jgi:ADP-dependent NAD(P)H-hydrate dehydratase / NAD(P)H-hydrate epimerase